MLRLGSFTKGDISCLAIFTVVQRKDSLTNHKKPKHLLSNALSSFQRSHCVQFLKEKLKNMLSFHTPFIYLNYSAKESTTQQIKGTGFVVSLEYIPTKDLQGCRKDQNRVQNQSLIIYFPQSIPCAVWPHFAEASFRLSQSELLFQIKSIFRKEL